MLARMVDSHPPAAPVDIISTARKPRRYWLFPAGQVGHPHLPALLQPQPKLGIAVYHRDASAIILALQFRRFLTISVGSAELAATPDLASKVRRAVRQSEEGQDHGH